MLDATTLKNPPRMSIGVVVRDHKGIFVAACCHLVQRFDDPEVAEAIATRKAVSFSSEIQFQHVIISYDCQSVVKKINSQVLDLSHVEVIIQDLISGRKL
uniref:RNase H type-1 domain-containing protein n=1 Tax=Setaria italica TaxID=4555 RepID=K3YLT9_SETIT